MTLPPLDTPTQHAWYLWAKSDIGKNDGRYLPVLTHLLDVAACAWAILEREPPHTLELLAQDYGLEPDAARRWVCALAGLHDLGKASPTFQALWSLDGLPAGAEHLRAVSEKKHPHGEVSQVLLDDFLQQLGCSPEVAGALADAVGCHHGRRSQSPQIPTPERGEGDWQTAQWTLLLAVLEGCGVSEIPLIPTLPPAAFMRLAGLTSFADWVGSSFEVPAQVDPLPIANPAAYFEKACDKARKKLDDIGWTKRLPLQQQVQPPAEMFSYIPGFAPRALQTQLAELLPTLDAQPTLILVEAPMGEGKTEAGLHAATWLQTKLGHRGLYLALPTMATGNAMYTRFKDFLGHAAKGRGIVPDLQLLHGGTLLNEKFQENIRQTLNPPNDPEMALNVRAESWFTVRKRANLTEYGVGTVDQALLGVLGVPHQFVRLWGLGNRVVLLDEIHAYDTYTSQLIFALIRWLKALGSSVILMSATLPAESRRKLLDAWGSKEAGETAQYPRLTLAQSDAAKSHYIKASRPQIPITVRSLGADVEEVAAKALTLAQGGGCVAVIVNTVQRAQDVFRAIEARYSGNIKTPLRKGKKDDLCVLLFHARYPANARKKREDAVLKYLGPQPDSEGKDNRPQRMILVATQVAEQSLDFDADVMITDLAPMDLMLQRAGRLHRHKANTEQGRRHSHTTPQLWVSGLDGWPDAALDEQKWQWVYAPYLLYRSWLALQDGQTVKLPNDLDALVQRVYGDEVWYELSPEQAAQLAEARADFERRTVNEDTLGKMAHIGDPEKFWSQLPVARGEMDGEPTHDDAADNADEEWPQTRLGEESIRIVPVHWVALEGGYRLNPEGKEATYLSGARMTLKPAQAKAIFEHSLRVSKVQLVRGAARLAEESGLKWKSWQDDPLLRDCIPLPLRDGECLVLAAGGLRVQLHQELGLCYKSARPSQ